MEMFKSEGIDRICRSCGHWWDPYESVAHHVVYRQHCPPGTEWDPRNALPLCSRCHNIRHDGSERKIPIDCLTDQNLEFAREILGEGAEHYLSRRYGASVTVRNGPAAPESPGPGNEGISFDAPAD